MLYINLFKKLRCSLSKKSGALQTKEDLGVVVHFYCIVLAVSKLEVVDCTHKPGLQIYSNFYQIHFFWGGGGGPKWIKPDLS